MPLISSTPILSNPTVGRSMARTIRAIAEPMTARSTRCRASAPMVAPRSRTIDLPRIVGHVAAIAGRSRPGIMCRQIFAMAIKAPVLPAETATSASFFFTASRASHIDDVRRPVRNATLGLASIRTETSVCRKDDTAESPGSASRSGRILAASPKNTNSMSGRCCSARAAPGTITSGPWSPPMASRAIRTGLIIDSATPNQRGKAR